MDYVKVHYNSNQPAQLNAHAYEQGTDIHLAPGQEKHLPHEAWHVVQRKQGRVKPTMKLKGNVQVNDDAGLEKEADDMGAKALNNPPKITFEQSEPEAAMDVLFPPSLENENSPYSQLIKKHQMGMSERLVLILALIPHIKPSLLDILNMKNELYDIPFTEFGGIRDNKHKGYLPTGETAAFLIAGSDLEKRFALLPLFEKEHFFYQQGILSLEPSSSNEPLLYGFLNRVLRSCLRVHQVRAKTLPLPYSVSPAEWMYTV